MHYFTGRDEQVQEKETSFIGANERVEEKEESSKKDLDQLALPKPPPPGMFGASMVALAVVSVATATASQPESPPKKRSFGTTEKENAAGQDQSGIFVGFFLLFILKPKKLPYFLTLCRWPQSTSTGCCSY